MKKTLESTISELNSILERMQNDDVLLDESLQLFEKAMSLTKEATAMLEEKKGRLIRLKEDAKRLEDE